jgi:hypothetical protein
MRLPTKEECDLTKPEEQFLWMLTQVDMGEGTQPQTIMLNLAKAISKHLSECGATYVPERQTKKYIPPYRGQQHHLNALGMWVPMDYEEPEAVRLPNPEAMTPHERQLMVDELDKLGMIPHPEPARGIVAEISTVRDLRERAKANHTAQKLRERASDDTRRAQA